MLKKTPGAAAASVLCRHLALGRAGRPRAGRHRRRAWPAGHVPQRQWNGADQYGDPALVPRAAREWHYIAPGKPQQNAFPESFIGRLRDECLNETLSVSLAHARQVLAAWKHDYNHVRPHSAHGGITPAEIRARSTPQSGPRRAPDLIAITAHNGHQHGSGLYF